MDAVRVTVSPASTRLLMSLNEIESIGADSTTPNANVTRAGQEDSPPRPPRILFLEQEGLSSGGFLDDVYARYNSTSQYLKTSDLAEASRAIEEAEFVWLEFASPLTAAATLNLPAVRHKVVVCRVHGFEVFTDFPGKVDWSVVDHLVFVADHKRVLFEEHWKNVEVPRSIIRNGINLDRFSVAPDKHNTKNLLLLGYLNHRKGLPLLMQFFHELLDYRWYQSQREDREVSMTEAADGYIADVLATLPDEQLSNVVPVGSGELVNKFDPSQGFVEEGYEDAPYDPWEDGANDPELELAATFDIEALRAKARKKA